MIASIIEIAATVIEIVINADFLVKFLNNKNKYSKRFCFFIIMAVGGIITISLNVWTQFEGAFGIIRILSYFAICLLFLEGTIYEKIFASLVGDISALTINFIVLNLFSLITGYQIMDLITQRGFVRIMILFLTKFLFFVVTRLIINAKGNYSYKFSFLEWIMLGCLFVISLFISYIFFELFLENGVSSMSNMAISVGTGLITINIISYFLMVQISKKNVEHTEYILNKMQTNLYKRQLEESENSFKEISRLRHDMKNHLQCIDALISKNESVSAHDYIMNILDSSLNTGYSEVKTGNKIIDIILNTKLIQCKKDNIETSVNIGSFKVDIDDMDICIILGNLLDNAIEECVKIDGKRSIEFSAAQKKGYVNFVIKNTIRNELIGKKPDFTTTKNDKKFHGIGIGSVKSAVKKNNGIIELSIEQALFVANIMLPCKY